MKRRKIIRLKKLINTFYQAEEACDTLNECILARMKLIVYKILSIRKAMEAF